MIMLTPRVCQNPTCGRAFETPTRRLTLGRGLYCSRRCASVIKGRRCHDLHPQAGANNHNFKGWASRNLRAYVDRFRAKHPEKALAHDAVKRALRRGDLVKPLRCEVCTEIKPLAGHHDDYAAPLAVIWACRDCHRDLDRVRHERERQSSEQPTSAATAECEVRA